MVALACSVLGSGIGSDVNKLQRNISSEDVRMFFYMLNSLLRFFWDKFELENVTKRSYVNKEMCEVWGLDDCEY